MLDIPEFDRLVFVICVLERYSMLDCALLLGRSPRDINEARQRVGNQVGQIDEINNISQRFAMASFWLFVRHLYLYKLLKLYIFNNR